MIMPLAAAKHALRGLARRWQQLQVEIHEHERLLADLTAAVSPEMAAAFGIGPDTAAETLIVAGANRERIDSEPAWAKLCGVCPVPASSGRTSRFRLNRGGHREANAALYVEVPATLTDRERRHLRRRGMSDPADALAIARVTVREPALPAVHRHAILDDLRLLVTARDELIHERTRVANRLHADLLVLAPGYSTRIPNLVAARHLVAAQRLLARSVAVRADLARARLRRLRAIDREIAALDTRITPLVQATGTRLPTLPGV